MKISIDFSPDLSYSGKAATSKEAERILADPEMARHLFKQILAGKDPIVTMDGTVFTKKRPKSKTE